MTDNIIIYQSSDGKAAIEVKLENESVWLTANQMAELFGRDEKNVRKHINNVFSEGELEYENNTQKVRVVGVKQSVSLYNLDVIISVGYRVKSQRGVEFRRWASSILKEYLVKGYAVNRQLTEQKYEELSKLVKILSREVSQGYLSAEESGELIKVVSDYSYALDTLDRYDYQTLTIDNITEKENFHATYENAMQAINELKSKFGESKWFGNEKDQSFKSSIGQIYQTFDGVELYPSVEEKAAMLLYLVTKNHSFSDGNNRIAAMLFLWFLQGNGKLYNPDGTMRIHNNTLVALTLMIAESKMEEMDTIIKLTINLINRNN